MILIDAAIGVLLLVVVIWRDKRKNMSVSWGKVITTADLIEDIRIRNIAEGEVLLWNDTAGEWQNHKKYTELQKGLQ